MKKKKKERKPLAMPHLQTSSHNTSQSEPQELLFKTLRMGRVVLPDLSLPLCSGLVNSSLVIRGVSLDPFF